MIIGWICKKKDMLRNSRINVFVIVLVFLIASIIILKNERIDMQQSEYANFHAFVIAASLLCFTISSLYCRIPAINRFCLYGGGGVKIQ